MDSFKGIRKLQFQLLSLVPESVWLNTFEIMENGSDFGQCLAHFKLTFNMFLYISGYNFVNKNIKHYIRRNLQVEKIFWFDITKLKYFTE